MPTGKIKMFNADKGFGFIVSALREGDEIAQDQSVTFEMGTDAKSGKTKAVSVDLT